tara:strand:+ start:6912 stop:7085 length:174 start_codon:yes stop_codon:yes gene_type:complete
MLSTMEKQMIDSLRTVSAGASGIIITWMEWLPVVVRIMVGLATFVYICVKIYKLAKS